MGETQGVESVERLLTIARAHGLELEADAPELDATGLDFLVLHGRDREGAAWIVRTPRRPEVRDAARVEARVLGLVGPRLPVAVPRWEVHADEIIAYRRLDGQPVVTVTPAGEVAWHGVEPGRVTETFVESLAGTLAALQSIAREEAERAGVPVVGIDASRQELARAFAETREVLRPSEATWRRWHAWLEDHASWPTELALVHGDLHAGHMLVDEDARLVGVLDWTEAKLTDPTVDFAMALGCFGREVVARLVERFGVAGGRVWPGLVRHAEERWAAFPALGAAWGVRVGNARAVEMARGELVRVEGVGE